MISINKYHKRFDRKLKKPFLDEYVSKIGIRSETTNGS